MIYSVHIKIAVKLVIDTIQNIDKISTEFAFMIYNLKFEYLHVAILNKK